ncbi:MAG: alpha/beta fold hydrolase [Sphingorhabdus sp.]
MRETLILVPGLLCDATVWEHQVAALSPDYDIQIADLTSQISISDMAAYILNNAPMKFSIAGHSMGARVALSVVDQAPDRVERIALLDTGVHPATDYEPAKRQIMVDLSARSGMQALADQWLPPMVKEGALDSNPTLRQQLCDMVGRMSPEIHKRQITALLNRPDARAQLSHISCPVLIGVGEFDRWSPPEQHEEIAAGILHAEYIVFPDSGHMAPMEAPEAVSDALKQWMRGSRTVRQSAIGV